MQKLHYSIKIKAPKNKVWEIIIGKTTYPQWTSVFAEGSDVQGDWSQGSKLIFGAPNKEGKMEGMVSEVAENKAPDYLSIRHLGMLKDGVEDTQSPEVKAWAPAYENYTLKEENGETEYLVDLDCEDTWVKYMNDTWPKALEKVKELSEK